MKFGGDTVTSELSFSGAWASARPVGCPVGPVTFGDMDQPHLLVIDGNSLHHRAWHAYRRSEMTDADGVPTHAVYGFFALLAGLVDMVNPDALIVGFDDKDRSVRRDRHPAYKAHRTAPDPDLYRQATQVVSMCNNLGVAVVCPAGWEADDVLGSAAAAGESAGWQVTLATSDRDSFQLISDQTSVLRLGSGLSSATRVRPAGLVELVGVRPDQYLDFAALRGDTSDNLPGVPGVGPKTAAKLVVAVERAGATIDDVLADPVRWRMQVGAKLVDRVVADRDLFELNRELMRIRRDLPVSVAAGVLDADPADVASAVSAAGFPGLSGRLAVALCGRRTLPPSMIPESPAGGDVGAVA